MRFLLLAMPLCLLAEAAYADDWPNWMGPTRDNVWREGGLLERFPAGGPKVRWRTPVASGYAGPAVADGRVFVADFQTEADVKVSNFTRQKFDGVERLLCLDEKSGEELWTHEYPVTTSVSYPAGPRCTPVVEGDRVYTLGAEGDLFCLKVANGAVVWNVNLRERYETESATWGYAAHPLIDGDKLITLAGGEGSHCVALDKNTGEEIWRTLSSDEQGYAPPVIHTVGGRRQLILARIDAVSAVDPESGDLIWTVPYEATSGSIIMTPVVYADGSTQYLYVAGYQGKSLLLRLVGGDTPEVVWRDRRKDAISPVNVQPILVGDVLYGVDEGGFLVALRLPGGERLWQTVEPFQKDRPDGSDTAFIVRQGDDDRYWLFTEAGDLVLCSMTPEGYTEIDRAHVLEPTNNAFNRDVLWSQPAFANRTAYVRNDEEIVAVDLAR